MPDDNIAHKIPSEQIIAELRAAGLYADAERLAKQRNITIDPRYEQLEKFITQDEDMLQMKKHVLVLANISDTVLIQGETGTGKELIARALHGNRKGKFIAINCAGMPENLIESELFGYSAGAFTDAKRNTAGLIEAAKDGTLFLDEVGDLGFQLQAKLLRCIQERTYRPVGSKDEVEFNARIISATHMELSELVRADKFRKDLYARLCTFVVKLKPLRHRVNDIPKIIESLITQDSKPFPTDKYIVKALPCDATTLDLSLNVRSLQQIVRRWQVLGELP